MKWSIKTIKRKNKDHKHKKLVKLQKQHLILIKSEAQLKEIRQNSKRKQK